MFRIGELMELTPSELNQGQALMVYDLVAKALREGPKNNQMVIKLNDGYVLECVDFIYATKDGTIKESDIAILISNVGNKKYKPIVDKVDTMRNLTFNSYTDVILKELGNWSISSK